MAKKDPIKLCHEKKSQLYHTKKIEKRYTRNFVTIKLRQAKRNYFNGKFDEVKDNIKSTWKLINNLFNKNKNRDKTIDSLEIETKKITNKQDIANSFNDFFVNISTKLQHSNSNSKDNAFQDYLKTPNKHTLFFKPVTASEIITIVDDMKNYSSSGIDDIDIKVVKHVISLISNPLASIFNDCLFNGTFPTKMKIAQVTPIHIRKVNKTMSTTIDQY